MSSVLESETESSASQSQFDSSQGVINSSAHHTQESLQNRLEEYNERLNRLQLPSASDDDIPTSATTDNSFRDEYDSINIEDELPLETSAYMGSQVSEERSASSSPLEPMEEQHQQPQRPIRPQKISIRFQPIGSIAQVDPQVCKLGSSHTFAMVTMFLCKKLRLEDVHCYISNSFAPTPQQNVGQLWEQFKVNDELVVSYCATVAFG
ncbi:Atg12p Ecym_3073 [Eremothecium cymbalariae DBVPG|uniref:Ubiquitin-like protein ATG12 n=1 Tax=Eremothecium cymbalariae (strain CBS 270.75 / DBVPG 7215 / KCTC 17166 / NRRL Y-17582) TaxID=931890 RepID=G8JR16_ERECY|nr:Hypothetical protein Ecym_3073 [Eremothecium cymbalariae DBVPG\